MARPKPSAVVPMEIFVEQNIIFPVLIFLKLLGSAIDGPPTIGIAEENTRQPASELLCYLEQGHVFPRARGTFDLEVIAVVLVEVQQTPDQYTIHRHPDRTAPVGIAHEHTGV